MEKHGIGKKFIDHEQDGSNIAHVLFSMIQLNDLIWTWLQLLYNVSYVLYILFFMYFKDLYKYFCFCIIL